MSNNYSYQDIPDDTPLVRYMTIAKFLDVLLHGRIFCPRSDWFPDKVEGILPLLIMNRATFDESLNDSLNESSLNIFLNHYPMYGDFDEIVLNGIFEKDYKRKTFVSSWFIGSYSSAAMLELYGDGVETIALETTVGDLKNLATFNQNFNIKDLPNVKYDLGKVGYTRYIAYHTLYNDYDDMMDIIHELTEKKCNNPAFFIKDHSYIHENEYRMVITFPEEIDCFYLNGFQENMIKAVHTHPHINSSWITKTLFSLSQRTGITIPIVDKSYESH